MGPRTWVAHAYAVGICTEKKQLEVYDGFSWGGTNITQLKSDLMKTHVVSLLVFLIVVRFANAEEPLFAWTAPLDARIPSSVPHKVPLTGNNLEFVTRFFVPEEPVYLMIYETVSFALKGENGQKIEGEYRSSSKPPYED